MPLHAQSIMQKSTGWTISYRGMKMIVSRFCLTDLPIWPLMLWYLRVLLGEVCSSISNEDYPWLTIEGPGYRSEDVFDLSTMQPYGLSTLYDFLYAFSECAVFYLPRTSDMRQIARKVKGRSKISVIHYCMEGASKVRKLAMHSLVIGC